jgi:AraC-like DNA-binding protein
MLDQSLPRSSLNMRLLLEFAARHEVPESRCLVHTGLAIASLADPAAEIATAQEVRVVENLVAALPERGLGLQVGVTHRIRLLGLYGFAVQSAPTLRDVVELAVRYQDLAFILARARILHDPPYTYIAFETDHLPPGIHEFAVDHALATVISSWREVDDDAPSVRIELPARQADIASAYRSALGLSPVFNAEVARIGFLDSELAKRRSGVDPNAFARCEQECEALLHKRRDRREVSQAVRTQLQREHGRATTEQIAAELHMSVRSLHRALLTEGTSFRHIARETQQSQARQLLAEGLNIAEIAERLGYHDSASFVNAYKRWHGIAPGRHRQHSSFPRADEVAGALPVKDVIEGRRPGEIG